MEIYRSPVQSRSGGKETLGTLGILVSKSATGHPPFTEAGFARSLCLAAAEKGLTAFAFTPAAETDNEQISGYAFRNGAWIRQWFPLPDLIYDRCFASGKAKLEKQAALARLAGQHRFRCLSRGTGGKWLVYQILKQHTETAAFLPETRRYEGFGRLDQRLSRFPEGIFLKPQFGMQGKLAMHLKKDTAGGSPVYHLTGRDGSNSVFNRRFSDSREARNYIESLRQGQPFLVQPFLQLLTTNGEPFDIRVLVQKDGSGQWSVTGMAARVGAAGSLTSNLHGGGRAFQAEALLQRELGSTAARTAAALIRRLSAVIPACLEERFGRLAELGIDFGVDAEARVWILEVNSKPGRSAFRTIGDSSGARRSVENPVLYACYLLKQPEAVRSYQKRQLARSDA
ncbi:YheC/YheD family protein [Paenibacillus pinistramenti]|uniref:YheC/YheD family endospore coat-associated protein n=1 Tax=Paenibacillus pinistramenti TaxID=1768003 RepID=UPI001109E873|nr:YheC/YheD family protein [Paenibacillus pinistramenti]